MKKNNVTVIGTGLSGLTLAVALARHDIPVTLIGPDMTHNDDGRTTAILAPNVDFLKTLDLWDNAGKHATPLMTMELIDGNKTFTFDCSEMNLPEFGFNVSNPNLKKSLLDAVKKNRAITWKKTTLSSATHDPNGWTLTLANNEIVHTALLIGADGRHSAVRNAAHIAIHEKPEHQAALVTLLAAEKPHHGTSVERYRSGGPFTLVPCADKKLALVWCDDETLLQEKCDLPLDVLAAEITAITEKQFGKITVLHHPQLWPVRPMKAEHMVTAHTALIGEAAHVLPPIGAQGFNTSITDIIALTGVLARGARLGLAVYDLTLLKEYERLRSAAILARYHGITRLNDMIRANHAAGRNLRSISLRILTKITPLKKHIMQMGLGRRAS